MILQLDMGNSRAKWRLREGGGTLAEGVENYVDGWQWLAPLAARGPEAVWVSCVAAVEVRQAFIESCWRLGLPQPAFATSGECFGDLVNGYADAVQLGVDRWLAMIAARREAGARACVLVDSGTALTVDIIDANGRHLGGYIAPGLASQRQALSASASSLRLDNDVAWQSVAPGVTTRQCMASALLLMGRGLIEGALAAAAAEGEVPLCYITGGDAPVWLAQFARAERRQALVLDGLEAYFS